MLNKQKILPFILSALLITTLTGCTKKSIDKSNYSNEKLTYSTTQSAITAPQNEIIATFTTKIHDHSKGRMNNLNVAAKELSNTKVDINETFSFNDKMGPYSKQNGYEKGKIFDSKGNVLKDYGGGICQVSTTLYNAVNQLGVEILERSTHSNKVQYIEHGKDATVSYGHLDFKFKNTTNNVLNILCKVDNDNVTIEIEKVLQ